MHEFQQPTWIPGCQFGIIGQPFASDYLINTLQQLNPAMFSLQDQQDAEEFLTYLLQELHLEMSKGNSSLECFWKVEKYLFISMDIC